MKIIFFSRNMSHYKAAMYQKDVMEETARDAHVFFYGPGFHGYNKADAIADVIKKSAISPDCIIVGHSWLEDKEEEDVDPHPNLNLDKISIPKIAILNKEYLNLEKKLTYFKKNNFDLIFTHHHDTEKYNKLTGIDFIFWPFAFNPKLFNQNKKIKKIYDFTFTGILQNQSTNSNQSDIRVRILNKIFHSFGDIPFIKKKKFRDYNIFWNTIPRKTTHKKLINVLGKYRHLNDIEYSNLQKQTKVYLNTLSPKGLVGTRYFENMASEALVFCEESPFYKSVFPDQCYVSFKPDLSDFEKKFFYYLNNENERNKITEFAYNEVMNNHTWQIRVKQMLDMIDKHFSV